MEYYGHNRNVCRAPIQYWRVPRYTYVVQRASNSAMEKKKTPQPESAERASVRGILFLPQIAARAGESVFGAKIPLP